MAVKKRRVFDLREAFKISIIIWNMKGGESGVLSNLKLLSLAEKTDELPGGLKKNG